MADAFGAYADPSGTDYVTAAQIQKLTDIDENFSCAYKTSTPYSASVKKDKNCYKITEFVYYSGTSGKTATWTKASGGNWVVSQTTSTSFTVPSGYTDAGSYPAN